MPKPLPRPVYQFSPIGTAVPAGTDVWVLSTDRVVDAEASSARLGDQLARLEQQREVADRFRLPNVLVWELRWTP